MARVYHPDLMRGTGSTVDRSRARAGKLPWPILVYLATLIIPFNLAVNFGPLMINPYRIFALLVAIPAVLRIASGRVRLGWPDVVMIAFSIWATICILVNYPEGRNIERGGMFLIETLVVYLVARVYLERIEQILTLFKYLFVVTMILLIMAIPEAIAHSKVLLTWTGQLSGFGLGGLALDGTDVRMGLRRAQGPFEHAILFGVFCASCFSLVWYNERNKKARNIKVGLIAFATFLSLSSAPLIMVILQGGLIAFEQFTRHIRNRISIALASLAMIIIMLEFFTESGALRVIIRYLTFDPATGYVRMSIWEHGMENVKRSPLFGLIPEEWVRPLGLTSSIDAYWLFIGMLSGFLGWALLALVPLILFRYMAAIPARYLSREQADLRRSWVVVMIAFVIGAFTVSFFGKLQPHFFLILGAGASLATILVNSARREANRRRTELSGSLRRDATGPGR